MKNYLSPSILTCDFTNIGAALKSVESGGADRIHCDVMDGIFVPNISFGQKMVADVRCAVGLTVDLHLMIVEPIRYVEEFAKDADIITFHIEAVINPVETIMKIKAAGKKAGLAVKPSTDVKTIFPFLSLIDLALIMGVEPGFGGQKFMPAALDKIKELRKAVGNKIDVEVDGGVNEKNVKEIIGAGANSVVVGNAIFASSDPIKKTREFKELIG